MKEMTPTTFAEGLVYPEGLRWHQGKLWISDMRGLWVSTADKRGRIEHLFQVPNRPSGLGFLPDGRMLVVSMLDKQVLRLDPDGLHLHADVSSIAYGNLNDMVVDGEGRAYAGHGGWRGEDHRLAHIILITPDGKARIAADNMNFPNGTVITPDGKTMVVAETFAHKLTAFTIQRDGSLTDRRTWAVLPEDKTPDGMTQDAEGAIWLGSFRTCEYLRVLQGGEITHRVSTPKRWALSCMLGGDDRKTLYMATGETTSERLQKNDSVGRVEMVRVDVPGAGLP